MAHVSFHLHRRVVMFPQREHAVNVVPPQAVYDRLDRLERPFVEDKIALQDVDWRGHQS